LYIKNIELRNFRNYDSLKLKLTPGINIFYGENGSGKTNILESAYYTAMTKSFRTTEDGIMIKHGGKNLSVSLDVVNSDIEKNYLLEYDLDSRKKAVRENNSRFSRMSMAVGKIPVVLFSPDNMMMIKGDPSVRRKFIDDMLSQVDNEYLQTLLKYTKEVSHRNYLLKGIRDGRIKQENLNVWNEQIMENGTKLLMCRAQALGRLNTILENELTGGKFTIRVNYTSKIFNSFSEEDIKNSYREFFKTRVDEEIARAVTLIGPHKDDLDISYSGQHAKSFASEGQQRITAILIKLAEGLFIRSKRGCYPVVMLDDFSSELDEPNRGFISKTFELFKQILITTTYKDNLKGFSPSREFMVTAGKIVEL
jgi:DNA replication and repair protein RecF